MRVSTCLPGWWPLHLPFQTPAVKIPQCHSQIFVASIKLSFGPPFNDIASFTGINAQPPFLEGCDDGGGRSDPSFLSPRLCHQHLSNFDPVSFLFQNSHAACQTELLLFNPIIQDLLHCPADVHSHAQEGGGPIPSVSLVRPPCAPHGALTRPGKRLQEHTSPKLRLLLWISVPLLSSRDLAAPERDLPGELRSWGSYSETSFSGTLNPGHRGSGAVGLLQAQSRCRPACPSFALSSAVSVWTRGIRHVSKRIFLKKCAIVDVVQDVPPIPAVTVPRLFLSRFHSPFF